MTSPPKKSTVVPAIAIGGLIVGILDITSAFIIWWCKGVEPVRGLQGILFMYWFVLPHVFPKFRHSVSNDVLAVAVHMFLIGLPTALVVRRYSQGAMEQR